MIPYEFHITVSALDLDKFKADCAELGFKPVVLELQDAKNGEVFQDVQTTTRCMLKDDNAAYSKLNDLMNLLSRKKYGIQRTKIETSGTHPWAASATPDNMYEHTYFESHIRVRCWDKALTYLQSLAKVMDFHVSRNILKKIDDTHFYIMLTKRSHSDTWENFERNIKTANHILNKCDFETDKVEVEFVLFDSNVNHDNRWLGND
jgi:hypothetical protein